MQGLGQQIPGPCSIFLPAQQQKRPAGQAVRGAVQDQARHGREGLGVRLQQRRHVRLRLLDLAEHTRAVPRAGGVCTAVFTFFTASR